MINVTDKAAATLHDTLEASSPGAGANVLRLTSSDQGLALSLDEERDGDQVITHEERTVLVVDSSISQALDGAVVDAVDTPDGTRLVIQSPE